MTARVISVFSTKGGVGKTLIATNVAAILHRLLDAKTALIALDPLQDDAAVMLGPASSVQRVGEPVTLSTLPAMVDRLKRTCRFVLIDAGSAFTELAAAAFEQDRKSVV